MDKRDTANSVGHEGFAGGEPLAVTTICLDVDTERDVRRFATATPLVHVQADLSSYLDEEDSMLDWMKEPNPDICLIDFDRDRQRAIGTAERIRDRLPLTAVFAVSSDNRPDLIIQAMRCGCSEYLSKPLGQDQLLDAVARVSGRKREKQDGFQAQVLTFLGAKGGCGVTTVATHLGTLLAKSFSRKTLLVDLHPSFGEAALYLGLTQQRYDFFELAESTHRLDAELLQSFLLHHTGGLDLLPSPTGSEPARHISSEGLAQTIDYLRTRYEFLLVDCPPGLTEYNTEAIRRSDQVYLVTVAEVSALRNVVLYLDFLNRLEFPQDRVHIVLNRHVKRGAIADAEIEKAIRRSIDWKVPNQYNQVIRTLNSGDPVAQLSSSEVARNLMAWAEKLGRKPEENGNRAKKNAGILGLWSR